MKTVGIMIQKRFVFPKPARKLINRFCKIVSTASYLPEEVISTDSLIEKTGLPLKAPVIVKALGVQNRHLAASTMADSDVLLPSARLCLDRAGITADSLSRLIVNKYYGDNVLPMTASRLLGKLGAGTAVHAFDVDGGITAFLHSVDVISRFINSGDDTILLSSGGVHHRLISKKDPRTAFLFGDASASLLFGVSEQKHILSSYFYTNYQYYDLAKGMMIPFPYDKDWNILPGETDSIPLDSYRLENWKIAEDFYRQAVMEISKNTLEESGLTKDQIDLVLITENNRQIWELTLETLGIPETKSLSLIKDYGNTMTAMLPLLINKAFESGVLETGMNIMLISHGEGMNGGGLIYQV